MDRGEAELAADPDLALFLRPRHRVGPVGVPCDGVSTLGHVVESIGVPLTEVGSLVVNDQQATPAYRPQGGDKVRVHGITRPQRISPARFILDVHLGTVARRLRLAGIDTAYSTDADDDALIEQANLEHRVLLTQDRGILRRRALVTGAYVRGDRPDSQLGDVLDRFAPPLAPWTRCTTCNGLLAGAAKADVESQLQPGTRRNYSAFARCQECGQVYWRGAHSERLAAIVDFAMRTVAERSAQGGRKVPYLGADP